LKNNQSVSKLSTLLRIVSSNTFLHMTAVILVEGAMHGLELISINHGWQSSDNMKSAPYSSNVLCTTYVSKHTVAYRLEKSGRTQWVFGVIGPNPVATNLK